MTKKNTAILSCVLFLMPLACATNKEAPPEANITNPASAQLPASIVGAENTVMSNQLQVEAKVLSVNKKTREINLKAESGEEMSIIAGKEVKNFSQIKKGDRLKVNYLESLVWNLKKGGGAPITMTESKDISQAEPGQKPYGQILDKVTARGTVTKRDSKTQSITVQGPHRTVVFKVAKPEVFKDIKVGDQIEATYTEALAVSVEAVKK